MRRTGPGKYEGKGEGRLALALVPIVIIIVVIVVVAGVGIFYLVGGGGNSSSVSRTQSSSQRSTGVSTSASSTTSPHLISTSSTGRSSTGSSGVSTYSGTFNFSLVLGPGGERVFSNNTVQQYNTTQVASGSFTFTISPQNSSGSGSGHGTMTATTRGFCSGSVTVPYTFKITDATTLLGGNFTVFFGSPTPSMFMVPLACTGPMNGVDTTVNNPVPFLAEYPGEITTANIPVTVTQHLTGNINYYYNIIQTG